MLTNKLNLPAPLVRAVENDSYNRGSSDFTVTQLLKPAYMCKLEREHEPVEDVADRLWSLYGQLIHGCIERFHVLGEGIVEKRLYLTVNGKRVGGQLDQLENGVLTDWKFTTIWSAKGKDEWVKQLNMLKLIVEASGDDEVAPHTPIKKLQIVALFRDWQKSKSGQGDYPEKPIQVIDIPIWDSSKTLAYMKERVEHHMQENPDPCTDEDRWMKPPVFALMKEGRKSAVKLYDAQEEAESACKDAGKGHTVVHRLGAYTRCESYCSMSTHCPVWQKHLEDNKPIF